MSTVYVTLPFKGYRLKARYEFWKLSPAGREAIAHGCGPGSGWKEEIIPDTILGICITPACVIHDVEYHFGGTQEEKRIADDNFLDNMMTINNQDSKSFLMRWIRRRIIFDYYCFVVDAGEVAFWKGKSV
jgi:hypothetical protein